MKRRCLTKNVHDILNLLWGFYINIGLFIYFIVQDDAFCSDVGSDGDDDDDDGSCIRIIPRGK
jgi:hypothetical protein